MYSMIQFGAVVLTYFQGSVLGNWQYLYEDLWLVFPLTILMGNTRAERRLSVKRPSGDLLSVANLLNLIVHVLLAVGWQIGLYLTIIHQSDWQKLDNPNNTAHSYATTVLYYFSNVEYTLVALLFAIGHPWKKSILTNWKFVAWAFISLGTSIALIYSPPQVPGFFRSDDLALLAYWSKLIGFFLLGYAVSVFVWDRLLSPLFVRGLKYLRRVGEVQGYVFQRWKIIRGPKSKLYHRLRGEFEAGWNVKRRKEE
jgi:cation-transporting ATPase 13A2